MRNHFTFYRSFMDTMAGLPDNDRLAVYEAIASYSLDLEEPSLTGVQKVVFGVIRQKLDANIRRWETGCKGGVYGNQGGAPKGNKNATKETTPKQPQINPKTTPNGKAGNTTGTRARQFAKPSIEEIRDFVRSDSISVDAGCFYNYYESNGWKVGRNQMKDWKAAVRTWDRKNRKGNAADVGVILKGNDSDKYNTGLW